MDRSKIIKLLDDYRSLILSRYSIAQYISREDQYRLNKIKETINKIKKWDM